MKINIAVNKNKYFERLYSNQNFIKDNNINLIVAHDEESIELLINSRIDAALVSPLSFAKAVGKSDLRIIPSNICVAENYTNTVSIYFNNNLKDIKTIACPKEDEYVSLLSQIVLKEKFEIFPAVSFEQFNIDQFSSDMLVSWQNNDNIKTKINLTEEWYDNFGFALPLVIWVCKAEDAPENIGYLISNMFLDKIQEESFYKENEIANDFYSQEGIIYWTWKNEFKETLENTFQVLYYHQVINDLPEVKLLES